MGLYDFETAFDRTFGLSNKISAQVGNSFPKHNHYKKDDEYFLEFALAGYSKEDISIEINDNNLILSSEKKEHEGREYLDKNLTYKKFKRVFILDDKIDVNNIKSKFIDGMLTISLPFREESKPIKKLLTIE